MYDVAVAVHVPPDPSRTTVLNLEFARHFDDVALITVIVRLLDRKIDDFFNQQTDTSKNPYDLIVKDIKEKCKYYKIISTLKCCGSTRDQIEAHRHACA